MGAGLAGCLTALRLRDVLPDTTSITLIDCGDDSEPGRYNHDLGYGTVIPPGLYRFLESVGLSEPELILSTQTTLSFGTMYSNWGRNKRSWKQCYHLPFDVWDGVPFARILGDRSEGLDPFLINGRASQTGRFAHPPDDKSHPLSRAEYGYQFSPAHLVQYMRQTLSGSAVAVMSGRIINKTCNDYHVSSVIMEDGGTVAADLFIDTVGGLQTRTEGADVPVLCLLSSLVPSPGNSGPVRQVRGTDFGWQSVTPLQRETHLMTVFDPLDGDAARQAHGREDATLSRLPLRRGLPAWSGNVVTLGQAAFGLEPLSPAPLINLRRDIERLVGLIPVTPEMTVEAREYNRGHKTDTAHAHLFNQTFWAIEDAPDGAYWQSRFRMEKPAALIRKITQFERRGHLVMYDHEPFNEEDWTILHFGMGRRPRTRSPFVGPDLARTYDERLQHMRDRIEAVIAKMPPHHLYVNKLRGYLRSKRGQHGG